MQPIEEVPDADWDRIFAVNIGAAFALSRAAAAGSRRQRLLAQGTAGLD
jgi:3-oxoacyl-[acyl-carrier protein] reductase